MSLRPRTRCRGWQSSRCNRRHCCNGIAAWFVRLTMRGCAPRNDAKQGLEFRNYLIVLRAAVLRMIVI